MSSVVSHPAGSVEDELLRELKVLSEVLWEKRCQRPDIESWLSNFDGQACSPDDERLHALHLLANVSYFGLRELRVLLEALFRDLYRYPIVQSVRALLGGTRDGEAVQRGFEAELQATRFLGMGNPAESGTHLLYYFRQENRLPKDLFVSQHQLLTKPASEVGADLKPPGLKRLVFIDDLCGSGQQAMAYSRTLLKDVKAVAAAQGRPIELCYYVLFGMSGGLERARLHSDFDVVEAVFVLDESYKTFSADSRVYRKAPPGVNVTMGKTVALTYGTKLHPSHPLGYNNGQLLLAFHHNIPDNSLPILWFDERSVPWNPIFPRYPKVY